MLEAVLFILHTDVSLGAFILTFGVILAGGLAYYFYNKAGKEDRQEPNDDTFVHKQATTQNVHEEQKRSKNKKNQEINDEDVVKQKSVENLKEKLQDKQEPENKVVKKP